MRAVRRPERALPSATGPRFAPPSTRHCAGPLALPLPDVAGRPVAAIVANMRHRGEAAGGLPRRRSPIARREPPEARRLPRRRGRQRMEGLAARADAIRARRLTRSSSGAAPTFRRRSPARRWRALVLRAGGALERGDRGDGGGAAHGRHRCGRQRRARAARRARAGRPGGEAGRRWRRRSSARSRIPSARGRSARPDGTSVEEEITVVRMVAEHERLYRRVAAERPARSRGPSRAPAGERGRSPRVGLGIPAPPPPSRGLLAPGPTPADSRSGGGADAWRGERALDVATVRSPPADPMAGGRGSWPRFLPRIDRERLVAESRARRARGSDR